MTASLSVCTFAEPLKNFKERDSLYRFFQGMMTKGVKELRRIFKDFSLKM